MQTSPISFADFSRGEGAAVHRLGKAHASQFAPPIKSCTKGIVCITSKLSRVAEDSKELLNEGCWTKLEG